MPIPFGSAMLLGDPVEQKSAPGRRKGQDRRERSITSSPHRNTPYDALLVFRGHRANRYRASEKTIGRRPRRPPSVCAAASSESRAARVRPSPTNQLLLLAPRLWLLAVRGARRACCTSWICAIVSPVHIAIALSTGCSRSLGRHKACAVSHARMRTSGGFSLEHCSPSISRRFCRRSSAS